MTPESAALIHPRLWEFLETMTQRGESEEYLKFAKAEYASFADWLKAQPATGPISPAEALMRQFEYSTMFISGYGQTLNAALDEMGADGWECFSIETHGSIMAQSNHRCVFKREITPVEPDDALKKPLFTADERQAIISGDLVEDSLPSMMGFSLSTARQSGFIAGYAKAKAEPHGWTEAEHDFKAMTQARDEALAEARICQARIATLEAELANEKHHHKIDWEAMCAASAGYNAEKLKADGLEAELAEARKMAESYIGVAISAPKVASYQVIKEDRWAAIKAKAEEVLATLSPERMAELVSLILGNQEGE